MGLLALPRTMRPVVVLLGAIFLFVAVHARLLGIHEESWRALRLAAWTALLLALWR